MVGSTSELDIDGDSFALKLNSTGTALGYSVTIGGTSRDTALGVAINPAGQAVVVGETLSPDFPTFAALDPTHGGDDDAFLYVLATNGASFVTSTFLGGAGHQVANDVAVNNAGEAHVAGFRQPNPADPNGVDAFALKLNSGYDGLIYSVVLGDSDNVDAATSLALGPAGNAVVVGLSQGSGFPVSGNAFQPALAGLQNGFISTISTNPPGISVNDASATESAGGATLTFTVSLSAISFLPVSVGYFTVGNTAGGGIDYITIPQTTLTFNPGETAKSVGVSILDDALDENTEHFSLILNNASGGTISDGSGAASIFDNDPLPTVAILAFANVNETNGGVPQNDMPVTLSTASGREVQVSWATRDGTAIAPGDYPTRSGVLTFGPGVTQLWARFAYVGDTICEANESFFIDLSAPVNSTLANAVGQVQILNDDGAPGAVQLSAPTYSAGEAAGSAILTVTRQPGSCGAVGVSYATSNGTATAGLDYQAATGTLSWALTDVAPKTFAVTLLNDTADEPNETVNVALSAPTGGATLGSPATATLTIVDDDAPPTLAVNDCTVTEGHAGSVNCTFTVSLAPASGLAVTVNYATLDGSAVAPGDYSSTSGSLTFTAGQTSKTVHVPVIGDTLDESHETFTLNLSGAANATIGDGQGLGTITDDDAPPTLAVNDCTVTEGNAGSVNCTFMVSLAPASGLAVTVNYATLDGSAVAPGDYSSTSGSLTFTAGQTSKTVHVPVIGDTLDETHETFTLNLSGAANATIGDGQGLGTITDDDGGGTVQFAAAASQAPESTGTIVLTVTRTAGAASGVTVAFAVTGGTATGGGVDYTLASGVLTFDANVASQEIPVVLVNDMLDELDETLQITLSNPGGGATLGSPTVHTLTILDDDTAPAGTLQFTAASLTVDEGVDPEVCASVSRTGGSNGAVSVHFSTAAGTATPGSDYVTTGVDLTWTNGDATPKSGCALLLDDTTDEPSEVFQLELSEPTGGASLGTIVAVSVTIVDDDPQGQLFVDGFESGTTAAWSGVVP